MRKTTQFLTSIIAYSIRYLPFFCILFFLSACEKKATDFPYPDSKIWAHRANDTLIAQQKSLLFDGLEVDLIYSSSQQQLLIGHDFADTLHPISLEQWFAALPNLDSLCFWLDIKNLTQENAKNITRNLAQADKKFNIKNRIFIESSAYLALKIIKNQGFFVMLWSDYLTSETDYENWKNRMQNKIEALHPDALSGEFTLFPYLAKAFPDNDLHLWHTPADFTPENIALTQKMAQHLSVKIILVDYPKNIEQR